MNADWEDAHVCRLGDVSLIFRDNDESVCVMVKGGKDHSYVPSEEVQEMFRELFKKHYPK